METPNMLPPWLQNRPIPKPGLPISGARMRFVLKAIGWSPTELAMRIHTDEGSVRQMLRGSRPCPDVLAEWLELVAAFMLTLPHEPAGWRPKYRRPSPPPAAEAAQPDLAACAPSDA